MRRARIKAVANVPLRRKAAQDIPAEAPPCLSNFQTEVCEKVVETETVAVETRARIANAEETNPEKDKNREEIGRQEEQKEAVPLNDQNDNNEINKLPLVPIPVVQSPDNGFAVLGSPPYRSDSVSIKSPASPSKLLQNRSRFVRPVPRLDGSGRIRRNSIQGSGASASESEDDSRRSISTAPHRIRNDSCCSVQSNKEPTTNTSVNNIPEPKPTPKRRMVISEAARKLAEARREFLHKHGKKIPDRNKLTMYDLIYYNPVTNPMKNLDSSAAPATQRDSINLINDQNVAREEEEEENVDEPTAMPVPQVKVGPDGQLIIDEQSLVIEQTGAKKGREALANSEVLVDEGRIGNGFYKRPKKGKDWPNGETLRFYIALNTMGTDFLLMQSLFPNRSREEIKSKFKKEERTNRTLVDKALKNPQEFDIDALKEEFAIFEEQEKCELEEKKKAKENRNNKDKPKTKKRKKCAFITSSIEQGEETEDEEANDGTVEEPTTSETNNNNLNTEKPKRRGKRKKNISIDEALDDLMQGAGIFSDSESETEIYEVKPTRSGRCPKKRRLQAPEINKLDEPETDEALEEEEVEEIGNQEEIAQPETESTCNEVPETPSCKEERLIESSPEIIKPQISNISKVEPGSLVILSSKSLDEPGKTMLQVYMVSPNPDPMDSNSDQSAISVDLSPELLATVTSTVSQIGTPNVDENKSANTA